MKHTPGPWTVHSMTKDIRQLDPLGRGCIPRNDADRELIAAAPELLWLLRDAIFELGMYDNANEDGGPMELARRSVITRSEKLFKRLNFPGRE